MAAPPPAYRTHLTPHAMRVAVIHDWLTVYGGAERVLEQILKLYPDAELFSLVDFLGENDRHFINNRPVKTSFIQRLPFARKHYRKYLPFMPIAIEQFDLGDYDMIISSSYAVAKGVITGPDQIHVSYVHSPVRYAWDLTHQYLRDEGFRGLTSIIARLVLHYIRIWDTRTAPGVDRMAANSAFVARRIQKVYGRKAHIIYPPVALSQFSVVTDKDDYYFTASRLVPYKRIDLIVEAFSRMPNKKLVVIGDGPEMEKIVSKSGPNVTLMGYQSSAVLRSKMERARAFLFAAEEDFGIVPVEAQACGTPVIAYRKGGAVETVIGLDDPDRAPTGVFFNEQTVEALVEAIDHFEVNRHCFDPAEARKNAERFSEERFRDQFKRFVESGFDMVSEQFPATVVGVKV